MNGYPGKVGIVEKDTKAIFASYLIRIRSKTNKLSPYYLFYFLLSDHYQAYVTGASTGTTRRSASAGVIVDINVLLPPSKLLNKFEIIIAEFRQMINILLDKNSNLRQQRDLLLPRLVNGELDVEKLEIETLKSS